MVRVAQILGKAGERFAWEGKSDTGVLAEPGVYLYRIDAGPFRARKKMVLLP